jgi:hypothetical protein
MYSLQATDCKFMTESLGMACKYAGTEELADGSGYCAHRAEGQCGPISYHNIKDSFEPQGEAENWIAEFNVHHQASFAGTWYKQKVSTK